MAKVTDSECVSNRFTEFYEILINLAATIIKKPAKTQKAIYIWKNTAKAS